MGQSNLANEVSRIFSVDREQPLLLRGSATGYILNMFESGFLPSLNEQEAFFFYAVPEVFDSFGIPINKSEISVNNYTFAHQQAKEWAVIHTTGYESGKLGDMSLEKMQMLESILQGKKGIIIGFNPQVSQLGMFPEYSGKNCLLTTSEPIEIRCSGGIPIKYVSFVEPIGEIDKVILLKEYERILGHKLSSEELARTTLR